MTSSNKEGRLRVGPEDQHPWDAQDEEIRQAFAAKDAEIVRLKNIITATEVECATLRAANATFEAGMHWRNGLITELCDALENHNLDRLHDDIIDRAREATR